MSLFGLFELFDTFSKLESSFSSDRLVCEVNDSLVIISLGMLIATNATVKINKEMQRIKSNPDGWTISQKCLLPIFPEALVRNTIGYE